MTELPKEYEAKNFWLAMGVASSIVTLPFFLYHTTKGNKEGKLLVLPKLMSFFLPLGVGSVAMIEENALWNSNIPTHCFSMFYRMEGKTVGLEYSFFVPETKHFIADVMLRQYESIVPFFVTSPVVERNGVPSTRYSSKQYAKKPFTASNASLDMLVGKALFGKRVKLGKTYTRR